MGITTTPAPLGHGHRPTRPYPAGIRKLAMLARTGLLPELTIYRGLNPAGFDGFEVWHTGSAHQGPATATTTVDAAAFLQVHDTPDGERRLCEHCHVSAQQYPLAERLHHPLTWLDAADTLLCGTPHLHPASRALTRAAVLLGTQDTAAAFEVRAVVADTIRAVAERYERLRTDPRLRLYADLELHTTGRLAQLLPYRPTLGGVDEPELRLNRDDYLDHEPVRAALAAAAAPLWADTSWVVTTSTLLIEVDEELSRLWAALSATGAPEPRQLIQVLPGDYSRLLVRVPTAMLLADPAGTGHRVGHAVVAGSRGDYTAEDLRAAFGLLGRPWSYADDLTELLGAVAAARL